MEPPNVANKSDFWLLHQEGRCRLLYVLLRNKLISLYKKLSISMTLWAAPVIRVYEPCFVKILLDCLDLSARLDVFLCRGQYMHWRNAVVHPCPYRDLNPQSPCSSGRMHTLFWQIAEFLTVNACGSVYTVNTVSGTLKHETMQSALIWEYNTNFIQEVTAL